MLRSTFSTLVGIAIAILGALPVHAQGSSADEPSTAGQTKAQQLETKQNQLLQRFQKLEELFLRMSELEAESNPTHSGLLMQAAQLSKQLGTRQQLLTASDLIAKGQLNRAIQEQVAAHENLQKLLELLQSENRSSRIRDERTKLEEIVNELRRLESIQRSLRGRSEAGQDMKQAGDDQKNLNEQIESLDNNIKLPEQSGKSESESKAGEPNSSENKSESNSEKSPSENGKESGKNEKPTDDPVDQSQSDQKDPDSESPKPESSKPQSPDSPSKEPAADNPNKEKQDGKTPDGATPNGNNQNGEESSESESDESESAESGADSGESESQSGQASKPKSKEEQAKDRVQRAKARMKKAQQELENNQRDEAVQEQRAAEKELREAVEELEKVLRQLREEEIERSLVDLETRIRKMHELQKSVRIETERLDKLEGSSRERTLEIQANKLVIEQTKVVMEGQKAMLLLQDEGSSTAFPEALDQVVRDAQLVSKRLSALNVSSSTQAIEDEVIASLEELLTSLKQVQKDKAEEKKKSEQQMGSGGPPPASGSQPLVDKLAELRLLKTLQLRINRRTQSLAKQLDISEDSAEQVEAPELREELHDLAERQLNILEVTREILIKENQE